MEFGKGDVLEVKKRSVQRRVDIFSKIVQFRKDSFPNFKVLIFMLVCLFFLSRRRSGFVSTLNY